MNFTDEKVGRFLSSLRIYVSTLFRIRGIIGGKDITISVAPIECNNYISVEFTNELVIPLSNIGETLDFWDEKQNEVSDLQLNIGDYTFISQFILKFLWKNDGDIILS